MRGTAGPNPGNRQEPCRGTQISLDPKSPRQGWQQALIYCRREWEGTESESANKKYMQSKYMQAVITQTIPVFSEFDSYAGSVFGWESTKENWGCCVEEDNGKEEGKLLLGELLIMIQPSSRDQRGDS